MKWLLWDVMALFVKSKVGLLLIYLTLANLTWFLFTSKGVLLNFSEHFDKAPNIKNSTLFIDIFPKDFLRLQKRAKHMSVFSEDGGGYWMKTIENIQRETKEVEEQLRGFQLPYKTTIKLQNNNNVKLPSYIKPTTRKSYAEERRLIDYAYNPHNSQTPPRKQRIHNDNLPRLLNEATFKSKQPLKALRSINSINDRNLDLNSYHKLNLNNNNKPYSDTDLYSHFTSFPKFKMKRDAAFIKSSFSHKSNSGHKLALNFKPCINPKHDTIPKIAHIIWFHKAKTTFSFTYLISLMSIQRFFQPTKILFWHHHLPTGTWWHFARQVPTLVSSNSNLLLKLSCV